MFKSNSVQSFSSDQLNENDSLKDFEFDDAPYDIFGEHGSGVKL